MAAGPAGEAGRDPFQQRRQIVQPPVKFTAR
jgi:hypothetical protein